MAYYLCNYSYPELLNTSGLERQGHGVLFPYNPEFYDRASSLYGPGTITAWYLLLASAIVNAISSEVSDGSPGRHNFWASMSGELVAFVAYPMFAATDLLVQSIQLIGNENRALAVWCLRNPGPWTSDTGPREDERYSQHPLDLANIPPDILSLGQRMVRMMGPLDVSFRSFPLLVLSVTFKGEHPEAAVLLFRSAAVYVALLLFICQCSLGNFPLGVLLLLFEAFGYIWGFVGFLIVAGGAIVAVTMIAETLYFSFLSLPGGEGQQELTASLYRYYLLRLECTSKREAEERAKGCLGQVLSFLLKRAVNGAVLVGIKRFWFDFLPTLTGRRLWFPDVGVAISELDQLAAVIAGSVSLCYSLYGAVSRDYLAVRAGPRDRELEENLLRDRDCNDMEAPNLSTGARRGSI